MVDKEKAYEYWCEAQDVKRPTEEQIKHAEELLRKLGYDIDYYNFDEMDTWEVDDLIEELRQKGTRTNFERITESPETLARFIEGIKEFMFYDLKINITEEEGFMMLREEKRIAEWLKQESKQ